MADLLACFSFLVSKMKSFIIQPTGTIRFPMSLNESNAI